jgi:hypothetical protein
VSEPGSLTHSSCAGARSVRSGLPGAHAYHWHNWSLLPEERPRARGLDRPSSFAVAGVRIDATLTALWRPARGSSRRLVQSAVIAAAQADLASNKVMIENASIDDRPPQRSIASAPLRPPDRITGSAVVVPQLQPDPSARRGFGAAELPHDGGIAADDPPVERVFNGVHLRSFLAQSEQ